MIKVKHFLDAVEKDDGQRIWVEPIGLTKDLVEMCSIAHVLTHLGVEIEYITSLLGKPWSRSSSAYRCEAPRAGRDERHGGYGMCSVVEESDQRARLASQIRCRNIDHRRRTQLHRQRR